MNTDTLGFIVDAILAVIIVVANIVQLIVANKMKHKLDGAQVIIRDTNDLRKALSHDLEGLWSLHGSFSMFQGNPDPYYSEGWLQLTWNPEGCFYNALYAYSVKKSRDIESAITAICTGTSCGDIDGMNNGLVLSMTIQGITCSNVAYSNTSGFQMVLSPTVQQGTNKVYRLVSQVSFGPKGKEDTHGELVFTRTI